MFSNKFCIWKKRSINNIKFYSSNYLLTDTVFRLSGKRSLKTLVYSIHNNDKSFLHVSLSERKELVSAKKISHKIGNWKEVPRYENFDELSKSTIFRNVPDKSCTGIWNWEFWSFELDGIQIISYFLILKCRFKMCDFTLVLLLNLAPQKSQVISFSGRCVCSWTFNALLDE